MALVITSVAHVYPNNFQYSSKCPLKTNQQAHIVGGIYDGIDQPPTTTTVGSHVPTLYLKSGTFPSYDAATATRDAHIDTDVRTHPPSNMKLNDSIQKHVPRQRQAC